MTSVDKLIDQIDRRMNNKLSDKDLLKSVHEKVAQIIDTERPNPVDFKNIVDVEKIREDAKNVRNLEDIWSRNNDESTIEAKRSADIAEYILYKNFATWINFKANPLIAAKADDYLRGIDLIIESEDENDEDHLHHLGLGIDIALVSEKRSDIESKKNKMRNNLEKGYLTEARYVSGGHFEGSLQDLPYTILSISSKHINDLLSVATQKLPTEKEKKHILKYIVAYQILRQLRVYYNVSSSKKFDTAAYQYATANNFAVEIFSDLILEIENNQEIWNEVSSDVGVIEIEKFCTEIENSLT